MTRSLLLFVSALVTIAAEKKQVFPAGMQLAGPYSPAIIVGDFVYVSGQGAKAANGEYPATVDAQTEQCLNNVKILVEAAGLTMQHVVYAQVYVRDIGKYEEAEDRLRRVFAKSPAAISSMGVARMPLETPVEISVVAVRDLSKKRVVFGEGNAFPPAAVIASDRVYVSGVYGRDPKTGKVPDDVGAQAGFALDAFDRSLKLAGVDLRHLAFVNPYLTDGMPMEVMNSAYAKRFEPGNTPARATLKVAGLPFGARIEFSGVAVRDLSRRQAIRPRNMEPSPTASPCVFAGDTLYCSAKSGFIPGPQGGIYAATVEAQVRQTMRNLLDGLEEAGLKLSNVVATNVYLDDVGEFAKMNKIYAQYFTEIAPARTTIQQYGSGERKANDREIWPTLEQISLVAVR